MNDQLLLKKKVNIGDASFLQFIHPNFRIVKNLDEYDDPQSYGIIYTGGCGNDIVDRLNSITDKWIIVNDKQFDVDLTTREGLVKNLLPLHYIQLKNEADKARAKSKNGKTQQVKPLYEKMDYEVLLEKVKVCLIDNSNLTEDKLTDQTVYNLFVSILSTPDILNRQFFTIVNNRNIALITSSVLTFLSRVQSQNIADRSVQYARLIMQSNKRYGRHIKKAISDFVKSKTNSIISLYHLLVSLNTAR